MWCGSYSYGYFRVMWRGSYSYDDLRLVWRGSYSYGYGYFRQMRHGSFNYGYFRLMWRGTYSYDDFRLMWRGFYSYFGFQLIRCDLYSYAGFRLTWRAIYSIPFVSSSFDAFRWFLDTCILCISCHIWFFKNIDSLYLQLDISSLLFTSRSNNRRITL